MQFDIGLVLDNWQPLAFGFGQSLALCVIALPVGYLLGILLALVRLRGGRVLGALAAVYVEVLRNIPFLTLVFLLFFVLPGFGVRLSPLAVGFVALSAYVSAYASEIVRGAIISIPASQTEAGYALGLKYPTILRRILLPQVFGYILPTSTNLAIAVIKESAVLSAIAVPELTFAAQNIIGRTYAPVEFYTVVALLYWGTTALVTAISSYLEIRLQPHLTASRSHQPGRTG